MGRHAIHICAFQGGPDVTRKTTYEDFRAVVLESGRFSVFEATESPRAAALYTRLSRDSSLTVTPLGFPWTSVKLRESEKR